jgi:hypothetical protein
MNIPRDESMASSEPTAESQNGGHRGLRPLLELGGNPSTEEEVKESTVSPALMTDFLTPSVTFLIAVNNSPSG